MSNVSKKMLMAAAGSAGGAGLDIDECFSCHLYDGADDVDQTITNNIDLTEGGLVWIKSRTETYDHALYDTERGVHKYLESNQTGAEVSNTTHLKAFNNNGFTVGVNLQINKLNEPYVSWTFRNSPMFQVVKYTGNGTAGRQIAHNLGTTVGWLLIKRTDTSGSWFNYHHGFSKSGNPQAAILNETGAAFTANASLWNLTYPTSTHFTVGDNSSVNASGGTYVAYLFAHHANDGSATGFGPDGDSPVISCGSAPASAATDINLGFEPQWIMIKRTDSSGDWQIFDTMRGLVVDSSDNQKLEANTSDAEEGSSSTYLYPKPNGFHINTNYFGGGPYIFMAIRRGSLFPPEAGDASKVFHVNSYSGNSNSNVYNTGFNADMNINTMTSSSPRYLLSRLTNKYLETNTTASDGAGPSTVFNSESNVVNLNQSWWAATNNVMSYSWKRAPSYFDCVGFLGTGSARTVPHSLSAVPEMIWVKKRSTTGNWGVYTSGSGATKYLQLNTNREAQTLTSAWNDTTPTSSVFTVGTNAMANGNNVTYIAYLFATAPGVSKVGSFVSDGNPQNIDCGFSSGARFVLIKRYDLGGHWFVFDTVRGIVSGNDPNLQLNENAAQESTYDHIDPYSAGFTVAAYDDDDSPYVNISGGTYIFYAIA